MTNVGRDPSALSVPFCRCQRRCFAVVAAWLASFGLSGCISQDIYQAEELPANLQAPHIENTKKLNLSGLTTVAYNGETIDSEDILEVQILVGLNARDNPPVLQPRVNESGSISLLNIGEVPVRGLDLPMAESAIAAACIQRGIFRSPQVTVTMKKKRTNLIRVFGAVKTQGPVNLARGSCDLFSAIHAAGGLADDAGTIVDVRNPPGPNAAQPDRIAGSFGNPVTHKERLSVRAVPPQHSESISSPRRKGPEGRTRCRMARPCMSSGAIPKRSESSAWSTSPTATHIRLAKS